MKVQLITPFKMQWLDGYRKVFSDCELRVTKTPEVDGAQVYLFMWLNQDTVNFINNNPKQGVYIVWCRRYELFTEWPEQLDWSKVDTAMAVNHFIGKKLSDRINRPVEVILNAVSSDKWAFKNRQPGKKIAMVGYINQKKNFPLAMQIMAALSKDYELHIAGGVQDQATVEYINEIAKNTGRSVTAYGQVDNMDEWLEDKDYLLSCAISEGCPNNVLEAMVKGIKPVIHNWPGAKYQFPSDLRFDTVEEAVSVITSSEYDSAKYRRFIEESNGEGQYTLIRELVDKLLGLKRRTYHTLDGEVIFPQGGVKILSYPRSGRTWLKLMLLDFLYANYQEDLYVRQNIISSPSDQFEQLAFTHSSLTWSKNDRVILLIRDPRAIMTSSYHYLKDVTKVLPEGMTLSEFIRSEEGGMPVLVETFNKWHAVPTDRTIIYYEQLVKSPEARADILLRIGKMLGRKNEFTSEIARHNTLENARNIPKAKEAIVDIQDKIRIGAVDSYKDELFTDDLEYIWAEMEKLPKGWFAPYLTEIEAAREAV